MAFIRQLFLALVVFGLVVAIHTISLSFLLDNSGIDGDSTTADHIQHQIEVDLELRHWIAFTSFVVEAYPDKAGNEVISDHQLLALAFARYANPHRSILLLVDNITRTESAGNFLKHLNVHVAEMDFDHHRFSKFKMSYKHSSLNDEHYEFMCFARFVALDIYMTNLLSFLPNTTHSLWFQLLAMSRDFPVLVWHLSQISSKTSSTALLLLSCPIYRYGAKKLRLKSSQGYQVGCRAGTPSRTGGGNNAVNGSSLRHFSDMHLTQMFTTTSPLRIEVMFPAGIAVFQPYSTMLNARSIAEESTCSRPNGKIFDLDWTQHHQLHNSAFPLYSVALQGTQTPLWGIHFQGNCKDVMCQILCPRILPLDQQALECCKPTAGDNAP
jgi:hypothetical protein